MDRKHACHLSQREILYLLSYAVRYTDVLAKLIQEREPVTALKKCKRPMGTFYPPIFNTCLNCTASNEFSCENATPLATLINLTHRDYNQIYSISYSVFQ